MKTWSMKIRGFLELSLLLPPLVNKDTFFAHYQITVSTKGKKKRHGYCYVIRREIDVTSDLNNRVGSIVSVQPRSQGFSLKRKMADGKSPGNEVECQ